jgi:hypothetical protein
MLLLDGEINDVIKSYLFCSQSYHMGTVMTMVFTTEVNFL